MIVKGIIKSIDIKGNTCVVRMPSFETAGSNEIIATATVSNSPGSYNGYKVEDVVWVAFENDRLECPVVIGKLYLGIEAEKADPRGTINVVDSIVSRTAEIPFDTKLGRNLDPGQPKTVAPYSSLNSLANNLNAAEVNIAQNDREFGNKFSQIASDLDGVRSEITQTSTEINSRITDEVTDLQSEISQTKDSITSTVNDFKNNLSTEISQTKDSITNSLNFDGGSFGWSLNVGEKRETDTNDDGIIDSKDNWKTKPSWTVWTKEESSENKENILTADESGLTIKGKVDVYGNIVAESGAIGGFTIGETSIHSGDITCFGSNTSESENSEQGGEIEENNTLSGVYIGPDGIRLGDKFKVDSEGSVTASDIKVISNVEVKYAYSSDNKVAPTSDWSDSIPTFDSKKPYLWTKTTIKYSGLGNNADTTPTTIYSVSSSTFDTYIRYSQYSNGSDMHEEFDPTNDKYIGILTTKNPSEANNSANYKWVKFVGDNGTSFTVKANYEACTEIGDGFINDSGHLMIRTVLKSENDTDITDLNNNFADVGQIRGPQGNGILSIEKTKTEGLVDTYTITYTDGRKSTYTVNNGQKGDKGEKGDSIYKLAIDNEFVSFIVTRSTNLTSENWDADQTAHTIKAYYGTEQMSIDVVADKETVDTYINNENSAWKDKVVLGYQIIGSNSIQINSSDIDITGGVCEAANTENKDLTFTYELASDATFEDSATITYYLYKSENLVETATFKIVKILSGEDGKDGQNVYKLDIENDFVSVSVDSENSAGNNFDWTNALKHKIRIYEGNNLVSFENIAIKDTVPTENTTGLTLYYKCDVLNVTPSSDNSEAEAVLTSNEDPIPSDSVFNIQYYLYLGDKIVSSAKFELTKYLEGRDGVDGENGVVYKLIPNTHAIIINVNATEENKYSHENVTFEVWKQDGLSRTKVSSEDNLFYKVNKINNTETTLGSETKFNNIIDIAAKDAINTDPNIKSFEVELYKILVEGEEPNIIKLDFENISVIREGKDGINGEDPIVLHIENDFVSLPADSSGNIILFNDENKQLKDEEGNTALSDKIKELTTHTLSVTKGINNQVFALQEHDSNNLPGANSNYVVTYEKSLTEPIIDIESSAASHEISISNLTNDYGSIIYRLYYNGTIISICKFEAVLNKQGIQGEASTIVKINTTASTIKKSKDDVFTPNPFIFDFYKISGSSTIESFTGDAYIELDCGNISPETITCKNTSIIKLEVDANKQILIHYYTDGHFENDYSLDAENVVKLKSITVKLRELNAENTDSTIIDKESINIVQDGQDGDDAISIKIVGIKTINRKNLTEDLIFNFVKQVGSNTPEPFKEGYYKINDGEWTLNETGTATWTLPSSIDTVDSIKITLGIKIGEDTNGKPICQELDVHTVEVLDDGADGTSPYTLVIDNEIDTIITDLDGDTSSYDWTKTSHTVTAYHGANSISINSIENSTEPVDSSGTCVRYTLSDVSVEETVEEVTTKHINLNDTGVISGQCTELTANNGYILYELYVDGKKQDSVTFKLYKIKVEQAKYTMHISNDFVSIPTDADGSYSDLVISDLTKHTVSITYGDSDVSDDFGIVDFNEGSGFNSINNTNKVIVYKVIASSVTSNNPDWDVVSKEFWLSDIDVDNYSIIYEAYDKSTLLCAGKFEAIKNKQGTPGADAEFIWIESETNKIVLNKDGELLPETFKADFKKKIGQSDEQAYNGYATVEYLTTENNADFEIIPSLSSVSSTSSISINWATVQLFNEATFDKKSLKAIRITLYGKYESNTTSYSNKLDSETYYVIQDGQDAVDIWISCDYTTLHRNKLSTIGPINFYFYKQEGSKTADVFTTGYYVITEDGTEQELTNNTSGEATYNVSNALIDTLKTINIKLYSDNNKSVLYDSHTIQIVEDGNTPKITIGENGHWFINGEDSGIVAKGTSPVLTIGANGNWYIDGIDTNKKAQGPAGEPGESTYLIDIENDFVSVSSTAVAQNNINWSEITEHKLRVYKGSELIAIDTLNPAQNSITDVNKLWLSSTLPLHSMTPSTNKDVWTMRHNDCVFNENQYENNFSIIYTLNKGTTNNFIQLASAKFEMSKYTDGTDGAPGKPGENAIVYKIISTPNTISVNENNQCIDSSFSFKILKVTGSAESDCVSTDNIYYEVIGLKDNNTDEVVVYNNENGSKIHYSEDNFNDRGVIIENNAFVEESLEEDSANYLVPKYKKIIIKAYKRKTNTDILVDTETILFTKDGRKGQDGQNKRSISVQEYKLSTSNTNENAYAADNWGPNIKCPTTATPYVFVRTKTTAQTWNGQEWVDDANQPTYSKVTLFQSLSGLISILSDDGIALISKDQNKYYLKADQINGTLSNQVTVAGFNINTNSLYTGQKNNLNSNENGVYIGTDGIKLGDKFKVDNQGNVISTSIKTISDTTVQYAYSQYDKTTNSNEAPSDITTWQNTIPEDVETKPYLWTKTTINYTTLGETTTEEPTISYSISSKGKDLTDELPFPVLKVFSSIEPTVSSSIYVDDIWIHDFTVKGYSAIVFDSKTKQKLKLDLCETKTSLLTWLNNVYDDPDYDDKIIILVSSQASEINSSIREKLKSYGSSITDIWETRYFKNVNSHIEEVEVINELEEDGIIKYFYHFLNDSTEYGPEPLLETKTSHIFIGKKGLPSGWAYEVVTHPEILENNIVNENSFISCYLTDEGFIVNDQEKKLKAILSDCGVNLITKETLTDANTNTAYDKYYLKADSITGTLDNKVVIGGNAGWAIKGSIKNDSGEIISGNISSNLSNNNIIYKKYYNNEYLKNLREKFNIDLNYVKRLFKFFKEYSYITNLSNNIFNYNITNSTLYIADITNFVTFFNWTLPKEVNYSMFPPIEITNNTSELFSKDNLISSFGVEITTQTLDTHGMWYSWDTWRAWLERKYDANLTDDNQIDSVLLTIQNIIETTFSDKFDLEDIKMYGFSYIGFWLTDYSFTDNYCEFGPDLLRMGANFSVNNLGEIIAKNATLEGSINTKSGTIGCFNIYDNTLSSDNINISKNEIILNSDLLFDAKDEDITRIVSKGNKKLIFGTETGANIKFNPLTNTTRNYIGININKVSIEKKYSKSNWFDAGEDNYYLNLSFNLIKCVVDSDASQQNWSINYYKLTQEDDFIKNYENRNIHLNLIIQYIEKETYWKGPFVKDVLSTHKSSPLIEHLSINLAPYLKIPEQQTAIESFYNNGITVSTKIPKHKYSRKKESGVIDHRIVQLYLSTNEIHYIDRNNNNLKYNRTIDQYSSLWSEWNLENNEKIQTKKYLDVADITSDQGSNTINNYINNNYQNLLLGMLDYKVKNSDIMYVNGSIYPEKPEEASSKIYNLGMEGNNNKLRWDNIYAININTTNASQITSDKNLKTNITSLPQEIDYVFDKLEPVNYNFKNDLDKIHFGLVAQDVQNAFNEANLKNDNYDIVVNNNGILSIRYSELHALEIDQIQKLKKQVAKQQEIIEHLEKRIEKLEKQ